MPEYSQVVFDSEALKGTFVKMVCEKVRRGYVQVYYLKQEKEAQVYVIDERGSLIQWTTPMYNEAALINPLSQFLRQVEYRQNRHREARSGQIHERPMLFF